MSDENPLARLGDLAKPATVLIEKISDAVGGVFKPFQIVRVAKAEAEANQIQAESQILITDLHRRAGRRFIEEEAKQQLNIEAITEKALPLLEDKSDPHNMADDWITNFFDKSRIVSDADMQQLWARVLAGEANSPGDFSKRTVNLLADLDKSDAESFTRLCAFGWQVTCLVPLIFNTDDEIYERNGIEMNTLTDLESLGLIKVDGLGFKTIDLPKNVVVTYDGRPVNIIFKREEGNELDTGTVHLTRAGDQLASVCGSGRVEGFFEFIYDRWARASLVPKRKNEPSTSKLESKHT